MVLKDAVAGGALLGVGNNLAAFSSSVCVRHVAQSMVGRATGMKVRD